MRAEANVCLDLLNASDDVTDTGRTVHRPFHDHPVPGKSNGIFTIEVRATFSIGISSGVMPDIAHSRASNL